MSTTNDSEDWLDAAIEEALPKALRVVYSSNLKRKLLKDTVLAHYAHYLKPEDVKRVKLKTRLDELDVVASEEEDTGIDGFWVDERRKELKQQLSKLNREEEKDAKT